jgi:hypothetical protein
VGSCGLAALQARDSSCRLRRRHPGQLPTSLDRRGRNSEAPVGPDGLPMELIPAPPSVSASFAAVSGGSSRAVAARTNKRGF